MGQTQHTIFDVHCTFFFFTVYPNSYLRFLYVGDSVGFTFACNPHIMGITYKCEAEFMFVSCFHIMLNQY